MVKRLKSRFQPRIVVADKGYHEQEFVERLKQMNVEAHVPPYPVGIRRCWVDPALYDRPEYASGQRKRKWIERFFPWLKTTAGLRKTRHRGHRKSSRQNPGNARAQIAAAQNHPKKTAPKRAVLQRPLKPPGYSPFQITAKPSIPVY
jgi:hypothetical protein